jgi:hypothetical protein
MQNDSVLGGGQGRRRREGGDVLNFEKNSVTPSFDSNAISSGVTPCVSQRILRLLLRGVCLLQDEFVAKLLFTHNFCFLFLFIFIYFYLFLFIFGCGAPRGDER